MNTSKIDYGNKALELAGTRAAVANLSGECPWFTNAWVEFAHTLNGISASQLAEQVVRRVARCTPRSDGRVTCELVFEGSLLVGLIARPLGGEQWLLVLNEPPSNNGWAHIFRDSIQGGDACDVVTGLPDRAALERRLVERYEQSAPFAVMFIDLDGFKQINDGHGHLVGDRALREAAQRMRTSIREFDFIARFGGDEFVVIAEGVDAQSELKPLLDRLHESLTLPLEPGEQPLQVSASIGAALSVDGYASYEAMLEAADARMYASRAAAAK